MTEPQQRYDLVRLLFGILFIVILIVGCLWVFQPFLLGFFWAVMVVIATWPMLIRIQSLTKGKRMPAVFIMTFLVILFFALPFVLVVDSAIENSGQFIAWAGKPENWALPQLAWLRSIPLFGMRLFNAWQELIANGGQKLVAEIQPYVGSTTSWVATQIANVGYFLLHGSLMVIFSAILYAKGEEVAKGIRHFAQRLANSRGEFAVILGAQAIRAVALGVVVTALAQAVMAGIGLAVAGIPFAIFLTVISFILCLAQIGAVPVLLPAIIWLYWTGDTTWGTILLVWSCIVFSLDNVLRPILIHMGADLPFMLVLCGVIGGLLSFGMIGLFIGPVVLAVSYRLISAWMDEIPEPSEELPDLEEMLEEDPENASH